MKRIFLTLSLLLILATFRVQAQNEGELSIISPVEGQVVQGVAVVTGTATVLGFSSYELSFSYLGDSTETWFVLYKGKLPVYEGELGSWDTTTLTDGDYTLRLQVFLLDGSTRQVTTTNLQVRNYTAVPTPTPVPTATTFALVSPPTAQLIAPALATVTQVLPTPTSFASNPAGLEVPSISTALGKGAILALLLFLGFGLVLRLRRE